LRGEYDFHVIAGVDNDVGFALTSHYIHRRREPVRSFSRQFAEHDGWSAGETRRLASEQ